MESKGIPNRKANRDRAALIYMSPIISTLQDYLLGNSMTCLKVVTIAIVTRHMCLCHTDSLSADNQSPFNVSEIQYCFGLCCGVKRRHSP